MEFVIKGRTRKHVVPFTDVELIEADSKYLSIYAKGMVYIHDVSIKSILKKYPDVFMEVKRGKLVNPNKIRGYQVEPDGTMRVIPIAPSWYPRFKVTRRKVKAVRAAFPQLPNP